jgi:type VI secretion system secreted protein VgrG
MLNRIIARSPAEELLFWKLSGREALSEPFSLNVTLLSPHPRIDSATLLGQPLTLQIPLQHTASFRWLNGKITRVVVGSQELDGTRYTSYALTLESDLWPMKRDRNLRIFQETTVPLIVKTLLSEYQVNVEDRLTGNYRNWEYCVQYQESSLDFISRLMELEGISYFFRHEDGNHTLVLTDSPDAHKPFPTYEAIPYYQTATGGVADAEGIARWQPEMRVTPGLYSVDDYDFRKPHAWLLQARQNPTSPRPGNIDVYDWPGRYVEHGHGEFYARIRQQRWAVDHMQIHATATAIGICPGYTFTLINAPVPSDNRDYLIIAVDYQFEENPYASGSAGTSIHQLDFTVLPADMPFRPEAKTRWPRTYGPQTARVVGPAGESIWTDRFGRVKVKFHWDREAKGDDSSSCWIRVSSAWAGQGYGGVQIPRVGDEVIVDFINGDPDRPIITGRVYNEASMPPWSLPAAATQMGFMSRTKDGTPGNANMLRFEDKAGAEQVFIQAERNMDTNVKNDESHSVGSNRTKNVAGNETSTIEQDRTETVNGNETITIAGNRSEKVAGNETLEISGNRNEQVSGKETIAIKQDRKATVEGDETITVQKNRTRNVKIDDRLKVDGKREVTVKGNQEITVKGNQETTVVINRTANVKGEEKLDVTGKRTKIVHGAEETTVNGSVQETFKASHALTVHGPQRIKLQAGRNLTVNGEDTRIVNGNINESASGEIHLKIGEDTGIAIKSGEITIAVSGSVFIIDESGISMNGQKIQLNA